MKRKLAALLLCTMFISLILPLHGCGGRDTLIPEGNSAVIRGAVLYDSRGGDMRWEDTYSRLEQSLTLNFTVEAVDIAQEYALDVYDVLYPDEAVMQSPDAEGLKDTICEFTKNGGSVFLKNGFYSFFDKKFIGAKEFIKLETCPVDIAAASVEGDLVPIQELILDFSSLYSGYSDYERLASYDYGYGVKPGSAKSLVNCGDTALYTMNKYGKGYVFFTNPLLPNEFSINGLSQISRDEKQESLANTSVSANQLIENYFSAYISKKKLGFSVSRVFGSFGRPSMAWELHFEEITGIQNGSAEIFGEMCRENLQIPSYTVIRNSYWWFLRAESVTYLLGAGSPARYEMDVYENAYSSGTHILSGDEWLKQFEIKDGGSYFVDNPEFDQRAYPFLGDITGDGKIDLVCGSSDGKFYFYEGEGFDKRLTTAEARTLKTPTGAEIAVSGYSSPYMLDLDGDGILDIISGADNSGIYWFSGNRDLTFTPKGLLFDTGIDGHTMPTAGDIDGDGKPEIIVGANVGELYIFHGAMVDGVFKITETKNLSDTCTELGQFIAPHVTDLDGDGKKDIAIGTFDGYIGRMISTGNGFVLDGYITSTEQNYKGNQNVKFANNCVPFFADINGDGTQDLLAGCLEYGMAYPVDSEHFPYRAELQRQIDYMTENYFYVSAHFYTNAYASPEREEYELSAHIDAMRDYGVDVSGLGTNQHTWYMSRLSPTQSLLSSYNAGLLWQSGFMPSKSAATPQVAPENVIALPFFLTVDGERTILVQNCSVLPYLGTDKTALSAKYGMPVCVYYHCDLVYQNKDGGLGDIRSVAAFQNTHNYNFVTEEQLMKATAAAYNLEISLSNAPGAKNGTPDFLLTPSAKSSDFPLFDERYQASCGVKIEFGEEYKANEFATDADVWCRTENALYLSLNRPVRIYRDTGKAADAAHLEKVNMAADITKTENGATVEFSDDGMMQITVAGDAEIEAPDWDVTRTDGKTVFTKFGAAETAEIIFKGEN